MSNPAFAAGAPVVGTTTASDTIAMRRVARRVSAQCRLHQPFLQSGKGSIFRPQHRRQIARPAAAMPSPKLPLASRELGID